MAQATAILRRIKSLLFIDSRKLVIRISQHIKFVLNILSATYGTRQATVPETALKRLSFKPVASGLLELFEEAATLKLTLALALLVNGLLQLFL